MYRVILSTATLAFLVNFSLISFSFAAQKAYEKSNVQVPSASQSVQQNNTLTPINKIKGKSPKAVICAQLSNQINQDKSQLRDVMGYLSEYRCDTASPTVAEAVCQRLRDKERNLTNRISANVREARAQGCTVE